MSEHPLTVQQRLVAILGELPAIGKTQRNVQQGFMFRGHDDILNALNPLLAKHGVFVVPEVLERIPGQRTTAKGNIMFEVNLHVRYSFIGEAGDVVLASAWGEGTDSGDKATSKAMTMAFKSVLNQAFAISSAETVDADADTAEDSVSDTPDEPPEPMSSQEDWDRMVTLLAKLEAVSSTKGTAGETWEQYAARWVKEQFSKDTADKLTKAQIDTLNAHLEERVEAEGVPIN